MSPQKPVNKPYILSSVFKLAVLNIKISSCMRICNLSLSKIDSNSTPPPNQPSSQSFQEILTTSFISTQLYPLHFMSLPFILAIHFFFCQVALSYYWPVFISHVACSMCLMQEIVLPSCGFRENNLYVCFLLSCRCLQSPANSSSPFRLP